MKIYTCISENDNENRQKSLELENSILVELWGNLEGPKFSQSIFLQHITKWERGWTS